MGKWRMVASSAVAVALCAGAATAVEQVREYPQLFKQLLACRSVPVDGERLACYDKAIDAIVTAQTRDELVVIDRKEVRETKKSLFGFTLPKIGFLGGNDDKEKDAEEFNELESVIRTTRPLAGGSWSLVLENGGTWETKSPLATEPRAGDKVKIRKASMGTYLGQVGINRSVRFRRVE